MFIDLKDSYINIHEISSFTVQEVHNTVKLRFHMNNGEYKEVIYCLDVKSDELKMNDLMSILKANIINVEQKQTVIQAGHVILPDGIIIIKEMTDGIYTCKIIDKEENKSYVIKEHNLILKVSDLLSNYKIANIKEFYDAYDAYYSISFKEDYNSYNIKGDDGNE